MVIGGFANLVWGVPRTTQDVDITVRVPDDALAEFVKGIGKDFQVLPEAPEDFVRQTRVLPVKTPSRLRVDLVFAGLSYEEAALARAREVAIQGVPVRIRFPEDLIIHKIISERPPDRENVEGIFREQGQQLDFAYLDPIIDQLGEPLSRAEIVESYEAMKRSVRR